MNTEQLSIKELREKYKNTDCSEFPDIDATFEWVLKHLSHLKTAPQKEKVSEEEIAKLIKECSHKHLSYNEIAKLIAQRFNK
jgi:DNA-binding transcriptional regulator YhcF (GntR family)